MTDQKIRFVAFDPGLRTGIASWNEHGVIVQVHKTVHGDEALDEYLDTLDDHPVGVFIIEEYRVYGSNLKANVGSKVHTAQVIGSLKSYARRHQITIVEQRADVKGAAAKWSGTQIPSGHMPDWMAAYLHGYYYLHRVGLIKPRVLERKQQ